MKGDDLVDMAVGFSYQVKASPFPMTFSNGLNDRDLGWMKRGIGSDLRVMGRISGQIDTPLTSTSATIMSNFDHLKI